MGCVMVALSGGENTENPMKTALFALVLAAAFVVGCGGSDKPADAPSADADAGAAVTPATPGTPATTPPK
ncbi:MAG: hypothetical protein JWP97_4640 [Labilithrix sp.]|nr:hypothetical protein [Labilithrix sp.]